MVRPETILAAQQGGLLASRPSYWFLGLFQDLSGSSALAPLARRVWLGLGLILLGTVSAYALSYIRTLRQIAEQPDISPAVTRVRWLPSFGTAPQTAIVHFCVRTLWRRLGLQPGLLAEAVTVTPSCGLAGASPDYARKALAHCVQAARSLADNPE